MEKLSRDVPQKKALKEADALRSYIYARRHFAAGGMYVPAYVCMYHYDTKTFFQGLGVGQRDLRYLLAQGQGPWQ